MLPERLQPGSQPQPEAGILRRDCRRSCADGTETAYQISTGTAAACGGAGEWLGTRAAKAAEAAAKKAAEEAAGLADETAEAAAKTAAKEAGETAEEAVKQSTKDALEDAAGETAIENPDGIEEIGKSGSKAKLDYVTSNGSVLETAPNKTTTVLGTYRSDTGAILNELGNVKSLDFGPRDGGFNLLNTPDELYISPNQFWNEYNKPWLDKAIARNDIFKIATEPTWDNLTRVNMFTGKTELTGFGREYTYLKKHGHYFDAVTKTMVK